MIDRSKYVWMMVVLLLAHAPFGLGESLSDEGVLTIKEQLVVSATRTEQSLDRLGSTVVVIDAEELERLGYPQLSEVLQRVVGLELTQTGSKGATTSVMMRGAKSEHTLVLLDGVVLNDPMTPGRFCDLAHFQTHHLERIEVLMGPQSTLYGSDAMGGVIQLISKKGAGPFSGNLQVRAGSFDEQMTATQIQGGTENFRYRMSASWLDQEGFSHADADLGNEERDGYRNTQISAGLDWYWRDRQEVSLSFSALDAESDLDQSGGPWGDDPNFTSDVERTAWQLGWRGAFWSERWRSHLRAGESRRDYADVNEFDPAHPQDRSDSSYQGRQRSLSWQHDVSLNEDNLLTFGLDWQEEQGSSVYQSESAWGPFSSVFEEKSQAHWGLFVQNHFQMGERWVQTLGLRFDDHETFGSETTYRWTSVYSLNDQWSLKGAYGTGFKAPSLYQLYSAYGSVTLQPEKSEGFEGSLTGRFSPLNWQLSLTYFDQSFEDLIDFNNATFTYFNLAEASSRGWELSTSLMPSSGWRLSLAYVWNKAQDGEGEWLLRRAKDRWRLQCDRSWGRGHHFTAALRYRGAREDLDYDAWPAARVTLAGVSLLEVNAQFRLHRQWMLRLQGHNLLDESYQEVLGYGTAGRSGSLGCSFGF
jgi:vitamin B12 transporter